MGVYDFLNFVVFDNPVTQTVVSLPRRILQNSTPTAVTIVAEMKPLWKQASEQGPWIRLAAVLGASAVAIGAYGAHRSYPKDNGNELKQIYDHGNRYHFYSTLALFGVPFCKRPVLTGSLLIAGTTLFSGACYYRAFTGDDKFGRFAPIGGTILIFAWLSMAL